MNRSRPATHSSTSCCRTCALDGFGRRDTTWSCSSLRTIQRTKSRPRYSTTSKLVPVESRRVLVVAVFAGARSRLTALLPCTASRQEQLEHPFVRLVHLLAHHPDFVGDDHDADEIAAMSKYIELYLDCLATQENVPYLYHLALKIKTVRDHDADYDTVRGELLLSFTRS